MSRVGVSRKSNLELARLIRIDLIGGVVFERRAAGAVGDKAGTSCGECCSGCHEGSVDIARARKRARFSGALVIAVILAAARSTAASGAASAGATSTRAAIAVDRHRGVVKSCRIRAAAYADLNF